MVAKLRNNDTTLLKFMDKWKLFPDLQVAAVEYTNELIKKEINSYAMKAGALLKATRAQDLEKFSLQVRWFSKSKTLLLLEW